MLKRNISLISVMCLAVAAILCPLSLQAQTSAPATASAPTTAASQASQPSPTTDTRPVDFLPAETIQARMRQIQDAKGLDDSARAQAADLYRQALEQVKLRDDWQAKSNKFSADSAAAPALLAELKAKLEGPIVLSPATLPASAPSAQLEQALARAQALQTAARNEVASLEQEAKFRDDRRSTEIPRQLDTLRTMLDSLDKQAAAAAPADEPADVTLARKTCVQAQQQMLRAQRSSLFRERRSYDDRNDVLTAQRDLANLRLSETQKLANDLRDRVNARRQEDAKLALEKAQETARNVDRSVAPLAELANQNVKLAQKRTADDGPTACIKTTTDDLTATSADLTRVVADYKSVSERIDAAGMSQAVYVLLRRQQASLPEIEKIRDSRRANQAQLERIRMELFELDDQRAAAVDVKARLQEILLRLPKDMPEPDRLKIRQQVASLLKERLDMIDSLKADYTTCLTRLGDLDARQKRLIEEVRKFRQFIDERVLWIRSTSPVAWQDLPHAYHGVGWLVAGRNWSQVGQAATGEVQDNWPMLLVAITPLAILLLLRRKLIRRLEANGDQVTHHRVETAWASLKALALTLLIALPLPLILLLAGWRLGGDPDTGTFATAVATGLVGMGVVFLPLELLRQLCRRQGLAEAHFRWPAASLQKLRHWLTILLAAILPLVFVVAVGQQHADGSSPAGVITPVVVAVSRAAFLLTMLAVAAFILLLLRPSGKILAGTMAQHKDSWLARARFLWYTLAVATPLLLATAALMGFYYTAMQLSHRLLETVALVVVLIVLHSLLMRWVSLARRRLAIERLQKQSAAAQDAAPSTASPAAPAPQDDQDEIALSAVGSQSRQFGRYLAAAVLLVGGWLIWSDVLPALGILRSVELWSHTAMVSQTTVGPDGTTSTTAVERLVPVTLADLLSAIGVAILVMAASRNLPGLMEITILRRLNWDFGSRYAFVTILRYVIVVVGTVIVFTMIGVKWASIQWLVAAVTVGLGFGLQEIFANFISGLILLFERPMRVGDMVTVGEVTGTVSRIRIRATTITDLDRKELIVPNKEFITGKLMNWTLSDTILRVVIPVGVNYDADTPKVLALLRKVADDHPDVMESPPPQAMFMGFGDSALNFELRVFAKNYETFHKVRNDLHTRILEAFRMSGIEIPFPQREIRLRTDDSAKDTRP